MNRTIGLMLKEVWPVLVAAVPQIEPVADVVGRDGSYALALAVISYVVVLLIKDVVLPLVARHGRDGKSDRAEQWDRLMRYTGETHQIVASEEPSSGRKRVWGPDPAKIESLTHAIDRNTSELERLREDIGKLTK